MGYSRHLTIISGVQIEPGWLYKEVWVEKHACSHNPTTAYCPVCGKRAGAIKTLRLDVSPKALKILGLRENSLWDALANGTTIAVDASISLRQFDDMCGDKFLFAGEIILRTCGVSELCFNTELRRTILAQQDLEEALTKLGIPFVPGSFAQRLICEAH